MARRSNDACHIWASQCVMNGVGIDIYAHVDDSALRSAAAIIAGPMGYKAKRGLPDRTDLGGKLILPAFPNHPQTQGHPMLG